MQPVGSTSYLPPPSGAQYAGPSQPYPDLAQQYAPGTGGGQAGRRRGPGRLIGLVTAAVVVAIAIGVGVAFALKHNPSDNTTNAGNTGSTSGKSPFRSVNSLNDPTAVPATWTSETYPASDFQSDAKAGFSIGVPPNWTPQIVGDEVDLHGPGGILFQVDLTPATDPNSMVDQAKYVEQQSVAEGHFLNYKRQTIQPVTVLGTPGAIWQFSWDMKGVTQFTDDIFMEKPTPAGTQSYALYLRAPKAYWGSKYLPEFDSILHTFRTVPAS
jgi:hypothetical protein